MLVALRIIVTGIILAGGLAGLGVLAEQGISLWIPSGLLLLLVVWLLSVGSTNRKLYRDGKADRGEVRMTTIGWRPDPIYEEDGMTHDPNGPSGNPNGEYYKVIRKKKGK